MSTGPADRDRIEVDRATWDERVPVHLASDYDNVPAFRAGAPAVRPFVAEAVSEVADLDRGQGTLAVPGARGGRSLAHARGMPAPPLMYSLRARAPG